MKKIISIFLAAALAVSVNVSTTFASTKSKEMKAVWVTSVYNIDFPSALNKGNAEAQKTDLKNKFTAYKKAGLNAVFLQVRPKGDALYSSNINPWSDVLTGEQGKYPGYDPLQYAVETAHNMDMELHAWLNPYRITTSGTDVSVLAESNVAKKHPEWLIVHNNALYLNPELEEVQNYISDTVKEILIKYNVDGIHFDDYFYPTNYPLSSGNGDGAEADKRRENINNMIEKVSKVVKNYGNGASFGISPMGIYKNIDGYITGSPSYYAVYGDSLKWIRSGWIDYITPQIYWETTHSTAAYENVVKWWNSAVQGTNVKLYIGEALYKDVVAEEIGTHLDICEKYSNVSGNFYYSSKDLLSNRKGCLETITKIYSSNSDSNKNTAKKVSAVPTNSTVFVDGHKIAFEAYNIDGFNYFKLRDIAYALNDTYKPFNTQWNDEKQAITLELGKDYIIAGGELTTTGNSSDKEALPSTAKLYVNGTLVSCEAYNIDGNNYYKLRDIASSVDFGVTWSETLNAIGILTQIGYDWD